MLSASSLWRGSVIHSVGISVNIKKIQVKFPPSVNTPSLQRSSQWHRFYVTPSTFEKFCSAQFLLITKVLIFLTSWFNSNFRYRYPVRSTNKSKNKRVLQLPPNIQPNAVSSHRVRSLNFELGLKSFGDNFFFFTEIRGPNFSFTLVAGFVNFSEWFFLYQRDFWILKRDFYKSWCQMVKLSLFKKTNSEIFHTALFFLFSLLFFYLEEEFSSALAGFLREI